VEEMSRKIVESGLVRKLEMPDPHLYFQAPGGQCLRLVGIDEDLSFYEGVGAGPDAAKVKEALIAPADLTAATDNLAKRLGKKKRSFNKPWYDGLES
jgi:hypothetical protein